MRSITSDITEVYYIISGTGTLVTGGTVTNPRAVAADNEIVKVVVGPSNQGTFDKPAQRRKVGPGDVVVIPPGRLSRLRRGDDAVSTIWPCVQIRTRCCLPGTASGGAGISSEAK